MFILLFVVYNIYIYSICAVDDRENNSVLNNNIELAFSYGQTVCGIRTLLEYAYLLNSTTFYARTPQRILAAKLSLLILKKKKNYYSLFIRFRIYFFVLINKLVI